MYFVSGTDTNEPGERHLCSAMMMIKSNYSKLKENFWRTLAFFGILISIWHFFSQSKFATKCSIIFTREFSGFQFKLTWQKGIFEYGTISSKFDVLLSLSFKFIFPPLNLNGNLFFQGVKVNNWIVSLFKCKRWFLSQKKGW